MVGNKLDNPGSDMKARFDALMRKEGPRLFTLAVRLTGNTADGQDLAADTFVRAFRSFDSFRGDAAFSTWVYRICMNLWKNRLRTMKRRKFWSHFSLGEREDEDSPSLDLPGSEPPLDAEMEAGERRLRVEEALGNLEPEDRSILLLRETEDRSYDDIASTLGIPLGTVKSRLARSRDKLRFLLKDVL